jgi:hypothetical protein
VVSQSICRTGDSEANMSAGAASAAAAQARRICQEEEEMTPYNQQELNENWEFKIVRSATNAFKDPEKIRAILEEEGRAGWVLVEKFDNGRMRLKRPQGARAGDATLGFDPYRTYVGMSEGALAAVIIASVLGGLCILIAIIVAITKS